MLKLVVLGAGQHSKRFHLPALAWYVAQFPGAVELSALCDLRRDVAEDLAARFGFARVYTDLDEMLAKERPDGCISITPWEITAPLSMRIISAGVPLLMEKPMAQTMEQVQQIVALAEKRCTRVMVGVNRRFSPSIVSLLALKADRPITYLRATMIRHARDESFFWTTAIHPIDAMRYMAGDVKEHFVEVRVVAGVCWYFMRLVFASGALGTLEILPTAGMNEETYELYGANYRAIAKWGAETHCWEYGKEIASDCPAATKDLECVVNGTYGETVEFISALKEKRPFRAALKDVVQSMELSLSMHAAGLKALEYQQAIEKK